MVKKALLTFGGLVLLGVLVFGFLIFVRHRLWANAAETLAEQLRSAKTVGVPVDPEQMRSPRSITLERNAGPLYKEAAKEYLSLPEDRRGPRIKFGIEFDVRAARQAIAIHEEPLKSFLEATKKEDLDFSRAWEMGAFLKFDEYRPMRELARLTAARAVLLAREGKVREAIPYVHAVQRASQHLLQEPTVLAMLVLITIDAMAIDAWEELASVSAMNPEMLGRIEREIVARKPPPNLFHFLRGEVITSLATTRRMKDLDELTSFISNGGEQVAQPRGDFMINLVMANPETVKKGLEARLLEYWTAVYALPEQVRDDSYELGLKLDEISEEYFNKSDVTYKLASIFTPVFAQAGEATIAVRAREIMLRTHVDLLQHHARSGRFPKTLSELGSVPQDPFDGKDLRYKPMPDGYGLYSVSRDRVDDGGKADKDLTLRHPPTRKP